MFLHCAVDGQRVDAPAAPQEELQKYLNAESLVQMAHVLNPKVRPLVRSGDDERASLLGSLARITCT
jgi:hypothetical protein